MTGETDPADGQDEARKAAIERLKAKRAFLSLLGTAAFVIAVCIVIWALSDSGYFWPVWVMVGFGFALAGSGWRAYGPAPVRDHRGRDPARDGPRHEVGARP